MLFPAHGVRAWSRACSLESKLNLEPVSRSSAAPSPAPEAYSATSDVNYYYDGKGLSSAPDYSLGALTKVTNGESETRYTKFDAAGRITESQQITDGLDVCTGTSSACIMSYQYNLAGMLTEETYPSGRIVHHNYAADGKLTAVSSRLAVNKPIKSYAQNFTYSAAGAVTGMQLGNMRWESTSFNSRLQPTKIALGTTPGEDDLLNLEYSYSTSANSYHDNNGNVLTQKITVDDVGIYAGFVATQTYTYDALNRLKSATENSTPNGGSSSQSWKQTYLYDRFGNRTFDTTTGATTTLPGSFNADIYNPTVNAANNRFSSGQGYNYDAAGNVTEDATGKKFAYDGENKQTSFGTGGSSTNGGTYAYDGDGRRVKKIVGTEVTIFVYDAANQLVAEYTTSATSSPQVNYLTSDVLSSPRMNTDASGSVITRHDYYPFGEEIYLGGGRSGALKYGVDGVRQNFTGKELDTETQLHYFQARYYSPLHGRFTGADAVLIKSDRVLDPQRLNRYAYVRNSPVNFVDPNGQDLVKGAKYDDKVQKTLIEIASRPGGRALLTRLDNYTAKIELNHGKAYGPDGERQAYGSGFSAPGEPGIKVDRNDKVVTKGDLDTTGTIIVRLNFEYAAQSRSLGDQVRDDPNNVPRNDTEVTLHELEHLDRQAQGIDKVDSQHSDPAVEDAINAEVRRILAEAPDPELKKTAREFVDDIMKPKDSAPPKQPATQGNHE